MEDLSGRQWGPYRIVTALGEGGMATVYKAYQPSVDRYVAIKVLPRQLAQDPEFAGRFAQEARMLANLQHPHILPVFDYGQADGYSYIVMPFIGHGTLADLLQGQPLPLPDIDRILTQTASALDFAHGRGLIHRDIKPSNILLDEQNNVLLGDFGIAKLYEGTAVFTRTGTILGTPAYMSPEQGSGQPVDYRSDIYSLGVVLYEMTTGRVPFQAETPIAVVFKHIQDPLPPPRSFVPQLPEDVQRVILKALAKRPQDRFDSAGELAATFHNVVEHSDYGKTIVIPLDAQGQETEPIPPAETTTRGLGRGFWVVAGLFVLFLLVGGLWMVLGNGPGATEVATRAGETDLAVATSVTETREAVPTITVIPAGAATGTSIPTLTPTPTIMPSLTATASPTTSATSTTVPEAGTQRTNPIDGATLVYVPAGQFMMGMTTNQVDYMLRNCDECNQDHFYGSQPAHPVQLDAYWIYQNEVTNDLYAACVADGACAMPARTDSNTRSDYWANPSFANYPVIHINWFAAADYCRWAGGRLPTEAEWEKAARGEDGRLFPWGDTMPNAQLANVGDRNGDTRPAGSYPQGASPYGVLDMAGNVWEWVNDWHDVDYFRYSPLENPTGPDQSPNGRRVGKGGAWYWAAAFASPAYHDWWEPDNESAETGFRCAFDS